MNNSQNSDENGIIVRLKRLFKKMDIFRDALAFVAAQRRIAPRNRRKLSPSSLKGPPNSRIKKKLMLEGILILPARGLQRQTESVILRTIDKVVFRIKGRKWNGTPCNVWLLYKRAVYWCCTVSIAHFVNFSFNGDQP